MKMLNVVPQSEVEYIRWVIRELEQQLEIVRSPRVRRRLLARIAEQRAKVIDAACARCGVHLLVQVDCTLEVLCCHCTTPADVAAIVGEAV